MSKGLGRRKMLMATTAAIIAPAKPIMSAKFIEIVDWRCEVRSPRAFAKMKWIEETTTMKFVSQQMYDILFASEPKFVLENHYGLKVQS